MSERDMGCLVRVSLENGGFAKISPQDEKSICKYRWRLGTNGYVYRVGGNVRGKQCLMHRIIAGAQPGQEIHHRNGDKLDNQRSNLCVTTPSEHQFHHREEIVERNRARRIHSKTAICPECNKEFTKHPDHRGKQKLCSVSCKMKYVVRTREYRGTSHG